MPGTLRYIYYTDSLYIVPKSNWGTFAEVFVESAPETNRLARFRKHIVCTNHYRPRPFDRLTYDGNGGLVLCLPRLMVRLRTRSRSSGLPCHPCPKTLSIVYNKSQLPVRLHNIKCVSRRTRSCSRIHSPSRHGGSHRRFPSVPGRRTYLPLPARIGVWRLPTCSSRWMGRRWRTKP